MQDISVDDRLHLLCIHPSMPFTHIFTMYYLMSFSISSKLHSKIFKAFLIIDYWKWIWNLFFVLGLVVVISHGRWPKDQGLLEMEALMPKAITKGRPAFWKCPTLGASCTNTGLVGDRDMRDIRLLCVYRGQHRNIWEHTALIVLVIGNVTRNQRVLQQIQQAWKVRQCVCLVCVFPGLWYFAGTLSWIKRWG